MVYIIQIYKLNFFAHRRPVLFWQGGLFSPSRLWGTQWAVVYTTAHGWARDGLFVAYSGRSKSRRAGSFRGIASAEPEPTRPMETPRRLLFFSCHRFPLLFLKYHSSRQRLSSHGTTAARQGFPVVTATSGASACVRGRRLRVSL